MIEAPVACEWRRIIVSKPLIAQALDRQSRALALHRGHLPPGSLVDFCTRLAPLLQPTQDL